MLEVAALLGRMAAVATDPLTWVVAAGLAVLVWRAPWWTVPAAAAGGAVILEWIVSTSVGLRPFGRGLVPRLVVLLLVLAIVRALRAMLRRR